jgi:DNA-binding GntR family transcriptional regulator
MDDSQRAKLTGVDTRPLRQQIADALQRAIIDGELSPGDPLTETDIANRLGVSRAPVREAIQLLASSGMVDAIPYKGTSVRLLSNTDIAETHAMRLLLESFAIRELAARRGGAVLEELLHACENMAQLAADQDQRSLLEADEHFHRLLISGTENQLLGDIWGSIHMRIRQIIALRNRRFTDPLPIAQNHSAIVSAIAEGDAERAESLLRAHLDRSAIDMSPEAVSDQSQEPGPSAPHR